jgi:enterochelin esterase-like enzyme
MKHFIQFIFLSSFLFLFSGWQLQAQVIKPGPQVATFYSEIDDSEQPYGLYIPQNYDPQKQYPLVIMLHGAMSNHRLALRRVFGKSNLPGQNDAEASRIFPKWNDIDYIVATPYARGTMGYVGIPEADVMRVIEACKNNFSIDENRVYLTGLSMGGGGTLFIGLTRPDIFAAIAPVCPAPPEEAYDLMGNALNLPVAIFQGGADPVVRPEGVRQIAADLLKSGASVEYHEFPGVQHEVWVQAYQDENIFHWFDGQLRNSFPQRVCYTTRWYKYHTAYWVLIDKMTPGTLSSIDARFTGTNNLEIKTDKTDAFTLKLKGHPSFNFSEPLMVKINGAVFQSAPKMNHSFWLKEGKWVAEKYEAPVLSKKPGLEGPLVEALTSRCLFVYGTQGAQGNTEIQERKALAKLAADFSVSLGGYFEQPGLVNPRTISDKEVTAEDYLSSNLLLFGTKETNSVIARLADRLPVHLNQGSKDYGLVYGYPVNGKMVVVISGIPFWTTKSIQPGAAQSPFPPENRTRTVIRFASGAGAKALMGMKDFLLFRETNDQVITEGYFDNDWKLPADAAKTMKESGIVNIK